jgi:chemotaxis protein methyltransferase CheR
MIEETVWTRLREVVRRSCGIEVPETSRGPVLAAVVDLARAAHLPPLDYVDRLADDRDAAMAVLEQIDLGLTWFMRDEPGIRALVRKTVALVGEREPWIWSAGCSTGEEPYTLAMAFLEVGVRARVLATDLNRRAIATAISGVYPVRKLKHLPAVWQSRFVESRDATHFRLTAAVRERVTFEIHNFAEATPPTSGAGFDAIVCRNALIYFERERAIHVMRQLAAAVRPGGSLLLGSVERPAWDGGIAPSPIGPDGLITPSERPAADEAPRRTPALGVPVLGRRTPADGVPAIAAPVRRSRPRTIPDVGAVLRAARSLERTGRLAEAVLELDAAVKHRPLAAPLHLARGLLLKQSGRVVDAVEALRSARFLDRAGWLAPYQLGCCLELIRQPDEAAEAYRHAIASVESGGGSGLPPDDSVELLARTVAHACRTRLAELARD